MIDRTVKNFALKELIATGGMAAIYKAIQISLDREVAVKILHGHLAQDKNFITRFEREAKAAANLKHENIVNIIDYGKADDIYFIAMEYVDGISLKDLMNTIKFIPLDKALAITHDIARGLAHAHEKGVVHRDIKPANILIGYDGVIKIADFGLAQAQDLISVTVTGSIVGTPAYMSPEQAGGKKVGMQTDIFSLGVVAYEMLTGNKPFAGETYSSVINEILTVKPVPAIRVNPLVSQEVNDILEKMLEKDTENRYDSIATVSKDISVYCRQKKIDVPREQIGAFARAPAEHFDSHARTTTGKHFERGLYYAGLGSDRIDDAIREFSRVVHLEPANTRAQELLADLHKRKAQMTAVQPGKTVSQKTRKRRRVTWPVMIILGGMFIVIMLFAATWLFRRPRPAVQDSTMDTGFLDVQSTPSGASIILDDSTRDQHTPVLISDVTSGEHVLRVVRTGYQMYADSVTLTAGETLFIHAVLQPAEESGELVDTTGIVQPPPVSKRTKPATAIRVPSYLRISVNPWAKIYIDGKYLETTPVAEPLEIPAGHHAVKLENPSFKAWQKTLDFRSGETVNLNVSLDPLDGFLRLTVRPWADVYIDGTFYETTPIAEPIKLTSGKHTIKLINPSFQPYVQEIDVPAEAILKKHVELVPKQ